MNKPKITVIIPLRNTKAYHRDAKRLDVCLRSLRNQDIPASHVEIIVSDIDSDANYKKKHQEICKNHKVRYVFTKTGEPWNISRARNIGIRNAKADYVMVTDVDCIFESNFIGTVIANCTDDRIVHCRISDLPGGYEGRLNNFKQMKKVSRLRPIYGYGGCQAVPKAWAEKVHGYDEDYVEWGADDTDLYHRAVMDRLKAKWIENETTFYHQWHSQENRGEGTKRLERNRRRLGLTVSGKLPIMRNPNQWGGKIVRGEFNDTAIILTTFLRDGQLYESIKSIRRHYPYIAVYVADNGKENERKDEFCALYNCTLITTPFDTGVGNSRNEVIKQLPNRYKFLVIIEDDIVFTPETKLDIWRKVLDRDKDVGIVGGLLKSVKHIGRIDQHYEANIGIKRDLYYLKRIDKPEWKKEGGVKYHYCDIVLNVFMMRRSVWKGAKWDSQILTAPEHEDFFLSLKIKTKWKVAYTDQTAMEHHQPGYGSEYFPFRSRNDGFEVFAGKWNVKYIRNSWHEQWGLPNPIDIREHYNLPDLAKYENLQLIMDILEKEKAKWWITADTCLEAIVGKKNFRNTDLFIGIAPGQTTLWDILLKEAKKKKFIIHRKKAYKRLKTELNFIREGVRINVYFFYKEGDHFWHGAHGPHRGEDGQGKIDFYPHVFSSWLFKDLKEIEIKGKKCFVPNPPDQYLLQRYGKDWQWLKKDYVDWKDCKAIDKNFLKTGKFTGLKESGKPKRKRKGDGTIAIGIKTFLREVALFKCLDSIEEHFPYPYRLYIADDGEMSDEKEYRYEGLKQKGHAIIIPPDIAYNAGLSVGRNTIVNKVEEDYLLILDDDIAIKDADSIRRMKELLDSREDMGIVAGVLKLENGDYYGGIGYHRGIKLVKENGLLYRYRTDSGLHKYNGFFYTIAEQVVNFFLAKREMFDDIKWDNRIKVEFEHMDFFLRLKETRWKASVCLGAEAMHVKIPNNPDYERYRRIAPQQYFNNKHNIHRIINRYQ